MRKNKRWLLLIFLPILMISCNPKKYPEESSQTGIAKEEENVEISGEQIDFFYTIRQFNNYRARYMSSFGAEGLSSKSRMDSCWTVLMDNKIPVSEFLLNFKGDQTSSLYGTEFRPYNHCFDIQSNDQHALFLIESLIQGSYFFNRRKDYLHSVRAKYENESLNFIYDSLMVNDFCHLERSKRNPCELCKMDLDTIWALYEEKIMLKKLEESPLNGTSFKWFYTDKMECL